MTLTFWHLFFILQPFLILLGMIAMCVSSGLALTIRLNLSPALKFLSGIIASFVILYSISFGCYALSLPAKLVPWLCLTGFALGLLFLFKSFRSFKADLQAMLWPLMAWTSLSLWLFGLQTPFVTYGGTNWYGDWFEHYHRSMLFLEHKPPTSIFLDSWTLPARGPLFNSNAAALLAIFGRDFWVFQIASSILNAFAVLPLAYLLKHYSGINEKLALAISVVFFGIAPFAVQQEACTITKFFTLGFILTAFCFYVDGMQTQRMSIVLLSFPVISCGILAHYLVVPFACFLGIHFLWIFRKELNLKKLILPALSCVFILATWFSWIVVTFGWKQSLTANSTLKEKLPVQTAVHNFAGNMISTFIPYPFRHSFTSLGNAPVMVSHDGEDPQISAMSDLLNIPSSFTGALGASGLIGLLILTYRHVRKWKSAAEPAASPASASLPSGPGKIFWIAFFLIGMPLNIGLHRTYTPEGLAHINLQPFLCLIFIYLIRNLRFLSLWLKLGLAVIFLIESSIITGVIISFQLRKPSIGMSAQGIPLQTGELPENFTYILNYFLKIQHSLTFLSDLFGKMAVPISLAACAWAVAILFILISKASAVRSGTGAKVAVGPLDRQEGY